MNETVGGVPGLFDDAIEAVRTRNATTLTAAAADASTVSLVLFVPVAILVVCCLLEFFCHVLSCTVMVPLYLAFVAKHEPTLLGLDAPRSDADPLQPTFEDERSRVLNALQQRAAAGQRLNLRFIALAKRCLSRCPCKSQPLRRAQVDDCDDVL